MIFVHCSKSAHVIGQNRSRVFWLPDNNESFECVIIVDNNAWKVCIIENGQEHAKRQENFIYKWIKLTILL